MLDALCSSVSRQVTSSCLCGYGLFFGVEAVQIFLSDGSCKLGENRWVSAGSQGYEFGACKGKNAGTATMPSELRGVASGNGLLAFRVM